MKILILATISLIFILSCSVSVKAEQGCCSHHGGEIGCSTIGKTICADYTYSPTCKCTALPPLPPDGELSQFDLLMYKNWHEKTIIPGLRADLNSCKAEKTQIKTEQVEKKVVDQKSIFAYSAIFLAVGLVGGIVLKRN